MSGTVKILAHFPTALWARPPVRLPLQQSDVQIAAVSPLALRDVCEPRGHEHEGAPAVREGAYDAGTPSDLAVEPLDGVVGAYAPPVLAGTWGRPL